MYKKHLLSIFSVSLIFVLITGTVSLHALIQTNESEEIESLSGKKCAIVTKSMGNPYNLRAAEGFQEVIEEAGGICYEFRD